MQVGNLIDIYKNETIATEAFRDFRLRRGIICKKCGGTHHYWLAPKQQFQCKQCRFRTTLQSGTILEGSKLPISYFFIAVYMILKKGNTFTIQDFQEETGHKYFEPLYDFVRKVKAYLNANDPNTVLIDLVELFNYHQVTQKFAERQFPERQFPERQFPERELPERQVQH